MTPFNFASPASTTLDELVHLRSAAQALQRKVKKRSAAPMNGGSVSRRLGRGLDFAEVREYQPGDDVRMIDWKVTARTGRAHTKLFVEERERPVLLVVDCRNSMRFGTRGMFKSVMAARLAALLGWCAIGGQDRVGGFVFTNNTHSEVRPQSGRRGLMALFRAMQQSQLEPNAGDADASVDTLADTMSRLRTGVHGGSTVVLLSDFSGFDDQSRVALGGMLQSLDVVAVQVCDPLEFTLPTPGRYTFRSNRSDAGERLFMQVGSKQQQNQYHERFLQRQADLKSLFSTNRHYFTTVLTSDSLLDASSRILTRQRQAAD